MTTKQDRDIAQDIARDIVNRALDDLEVVSAIQFALRLVPYLVKYGQAWSRGRPIMVRARIRSLLRKLNGGRKHQHEAIIVRAAMKCLAGVKR